MKSIYKNLTGIHGNILILVNIAKRIRRFSFNFKTFKKSIKDAKSLMNSFISRQNLKRQKSSKRQIESLCLKYINNFVTSIKSPFN